MSGFDRYQFGYSANGALQGSVTRLHDGEPIEPPTDVPFLEAFKESAEWARDGEVATAREYYSATAEALNEPLSELMPVKAIEELLSDRVKTRLDEEGNPIRWPLDADLCEGDWPDPCDEEAKAAREAALAALLPSRMQLALAAAQGVGVTLAVHGLTAVPHHDQAVDHAYRTEDKTAMAVISDMLLRGDAPYVIMPGAMVVFGDGLPVGTGFAAPAAHAPGGFWVDSAVDQGGVTVTRSAPIVDPSPPVLQDFLDDLCSDPEDPDGNFETAYSGILAWTERAGLAPSNPWDPPDPNYRETTTYIVKTAGRITSETRYVYGYQFTPDGHVYTQIERYSAVFTYSTCCPEALVGISENTWVAKQFDQAPGVGGENAGVPSEEAVAFWNAMPNEYLESSRSVTQLWHAEGWLRMRMERGTKFDGFEFSTEVNESGQWFFEDTTTYEARPTYSPSSRTERNVPVGGGVWMQHVSTIETINVPMRELVRVPNPDGPPGATTLVNEIVGSQRSASTNSYTVMTDQAPPTVSCNTDPCPEATCEDRAAKEYAEALVKWQEGVDVNAARRLNNPEQVLVQRFTWNGHHQLRVGDIVSTTRGVARVMSVSWSGENPRSGSPGRSTSAEAHSALPLVGGGS